MLFTDIISINDSILQKQLVKDNVGIGLMTKESVMTELVNGEIKPINIKEELFKDKIIIVYKNNKNIKNINNFIELLISKYK